MMRAIAALAAASVLSGCGLILNGTHADLDIKTRPTKAQVLIDGVPQGQSPTKVSVERGATHVVVIRAPGYKEQTIRTDRLVSGGIVALDILFVGLPLIFDAATGAFYDVEPSPMRVMLTPEGDPAPPTATTAALPSAAQESR